jgi:hypothetical protein
MARVRAGTGETSDLSRNGFRGHADLFKQIVPPPVRHETIRQPYFHDSRSR